MATTDPRGIITPEAFQVAPELLGLPLARPWRRLVAMLVDLVIIAFLVNASGWFLALAAAVILWRATSRSSATLLRRGIRLALRASAALIVFISVLSLWSAGRDMARRIASPDDPFAASAEPAGTSVRLRESLGMLNDLARLAGASTEAEARPHARRLAERLHEAGLRADERAELRHALARLQDREGVRLPWWSTEVLREEMRLLEEAAEPTVPDTADAGPDPDSVILAYADALRRGDTAGIAGLRDEAASVLAGDSIATLAARADRLQTDLETTRGELRATRARASERRSGFTLVWDMISEELGLGMGWAGLYFTAFLALFRGRTLGKKLMGIRVIRLDGKPIGWWAAFERFGGYAAAVLTGLLGFAQIWWDRNRQGVHDKITETVVIRV